MKIQDMKIQVLLHISVFKAYIPQIRKTGFTEYKQELRSPVLIPRLLFRSK